MLMKQDITLNSVSIVYTVIIRFDYCNGPTI
jgi:hypothetical protein